MDALFWFFIIGFGLIFVLVTTVWRCCENLNSITELITCVFLGKSTDKAELALKPTVSPDSLTLPLSADILRRVHSCTSVIRAKVKVDLVHKMKMLAGIADLFVTYDFEGIDPNGAPVIVKEAAYLRVHFKDPYNRYGWSTMVITKVESWQLG